MQMHLGWIYFYGFRQISIVAWRYIYITKILNQRHLNAVILVRVSKNKYGYAKQLAVKLAGQRPPLPIPNGF